MTSAFWHCRRWKIFQKADLHINCLVWLRHKVATEIHAICFNSEWHVVPGGSISFCWHWIIKKLPILECLNDCWSNSCYLTAYLEKMDGAGDDDKDFQGEKCSTVNEDTIFCEQTLFCILVFYQIRLNSKGDIEALRHPKVVCIRFFFRLWV